VTAPLAPGDEAWCLFDEPIGNGERRNLIGAGRVRIERVEGDSYHLVVLVANPPWMMGRVIEKPRARLFATSGPEHEAFGVELRRFWGGR
jgi:hypothetical protein